jgi:hypothetical protein
VGRVRYATRPREVITFQCGELPGVELKREFCNLTGPLSGTAGSRSPACRRAAYRGHRGPFGNIGANSAQPAARSKGGERCVVSYSPAGKRGLRQLRTGQRRCCRCCPPRRLPGNTLLAKSPSSRTS